MPTATERTNVRREAIGDSSDSATIPDADLDYYWDGDGAGSVLLTAALCCEMLAARYAGAVTFSSDGQSMHLSDLQAKYLRRAAELRARYAHGGAGALVGASGSITITRSDDVGKDDGEYSP